MLIRWRASPFTSTATMSYFSVTGRNDGAGGLRYLPFRISEKPGKKGREEQWENGKRPTRQRTIRGWRLQLGG